MIMKINKALSIKDAEIAYAFEEGADMKAVEIALNMLEKGFPIEVITDVTGLTVAELEDLQKIK